MDPNIQAMIEVGRRSIELAQEVEKEQERQRIEAQAEERAALLDGVRQKFPEVMRQHVQLYGEPDGSHVYAELVIPGLAPIYTMFKALNDGSVTPKPVFVSHKYDYGEWRKQYVVADPDIDQVEEDVYAVTWSGLRGSKLDTDSFEVALAMAEEQWRMYETLVPQAENRNRMSVPPSERVPQPEPVRDPAPDLQSINDIITDACVVQDRSGRPIPPEMFLQIAQARALVALCDRIDRYMQGCGF